MRIRVSDIRCKGLFGECQMQGIEAPLSENPSTYDICKFSKGPKDLMILGTWA